MEETMPPAALLRLPSLHAARGLRAVERALLLWAVALGTLGLCVVHLAVYPTESWAAVLAATLALAGFLIVHAALAVSQSDGDQVLLPIAAGLSSLSLIMIYRVRPEFLFRQSAWVALGLIVFLVVRGTMGDLRWVRRYAYLCAATGLTLLVLTVTVGVERYGARQWLSLGGVTLEPAEIVKLLLVAFYAGVLTDTHGMLALPRPRRWTTELAHVGPLLAICLGALLLLVFQHDLGLAALYYGIFVMMLYVATGRLDYVLVGVVAFAAGATLCYDLFPHVRTRVEVWANPWADPSGRGYQILQGLYSLASGGVLGTGLGAGHPDLVPAVHTDMIFPAIGEELGATGTFCVIALYLLLLGRMFRTAVRAEGSLRQLVAAGLAGALGLQTFIILGGSTRLIPLTGIPSPFLSYGGSAEVSNFAALAVLLGISDRLPGQRPPRQEESHGAPGR